MDKEVAKCGLCGEPMPPGEEMFLYHGYSGDCPKPPLPRVVKPTYEELEEKISVLKSLLRDTLDVLNDADICESLQHVIREAIK